MSFRTLGASTRASSGCTHCLAHPGHWRECDAACIYRRIDHVQLQQDALILRIAFERSQIGARRACQGRTSRVGSLSELLEGWSNMASRMAVSRSTMVALLTPAGLPALSAQVCFNTTCLEPMTLTFRLP